jgi:hypothetical protein
LNSLPEAEQAEKGIQHALDEFGDGELFEAAAARVLAVQHHDRVALARHVRLGQRPASTETNADAQRRHAWLIIKRRQATQRTEHSIQTQAGVNLHESKDNRKTDSNSLAADVEGDSLGLAAVVLRRSDADRRLELGACG